MCRTSRTVVAALSAALICASCASGEAARQETSALGDELLAQDEELPETEAEAGDGWPDASDFLSKKYGFLPIVVPITEPALGYGLVGGVAFISSPLGEAAAGYGRPNITFVGGFGTENDSRGAAVGDVRYWFDDRLQTVAALVKASVNLDFYGLGDARLREPRRFNLEPEGGMLQTKYRVADDSHLWAGLGYAYASTKVTFEAPERTPGLPDFERFSHVGGLTPSLTWDTRDNVFTPTDGTYAEIGCGFFAPALGSDDVFQRAQILAMHYQPLADGLYLGVRGQIQSAFGDTPFYLQPYVGLRGVPVMRFQGETAASVEAELRWQFWNRLSLVGFAGAGAAWSGFERVDGAQTVGAAGFGVRYELAREYGIHVGLDVAFSGGSAAFYVQIGSAWARP